MSLKKAEASLGRISRDLERTQNDREFLLRNTREIVALCGRSIIATHRGEGTAAKRDMQKAKSLLAKYRRKAVTAAGRRAGLQRYLTVPEQEFVEASCLAAIVERRAIPSDADLGVMPESYVLGLLDCVGELKRQALDRIREGDGGGAEETFEIMEGLYLLLRPFAAYDKVVKEARRKIDVGRALVDDVRSAVTEEKRRSELTAAIGRMEGGVCDDCDDCC